MEKQERPATMKGLSLIFWAVLLSTLALCIMISDAKHAVLDQMKEQTKLLQEQAKQTEILNEKIRVLGDMLLTPECNKK